MGAVKKIFKGDDPKDNPAVRDVQRRADELRRQEEARRREQERLRVLRAEQSRRLDELQVQEEEVRGRLQERTAETETAIDQELAALTGQVGFEAGQARRAIAGQEAGRGLLRSSIAGERFGQVAQQELQSRIGLQGEARRKRFEVQEATRKTLDDIALRRQTLADNIRQAETVQQLQIDRAFNFAELEGGFNAALQELQLQSQQQAAIAGALGGVFSNLVQLGFTAPASRRDDFQNFSRVPTETLES